MITEVKFLPITPEFPSSNFLSKIEKLLNNNIKYLIFRMNENEFSEDLLKETLDVVKKKNGKLIIHSKHLNLCQSYSKVHLSAKELMELDSKGFDKKLIGASCHTSEELKKAEDLKLDYVLLSPIKFVKNKRPPLGWEKFKEFTTLFSGPIFALGGLALEDLKIARKNGASGISGIRTFFDR